ncbi:hypothetical protein EAT49_12615 [Histidinibacterium lentulum]|uniref:Uncharacterized protein n=1 Tax=Histidinibacterium lentulum TaxID=2480588 RepID=A0A3N2QY31_9RHOB|nr:hypothetical protein EAT49_12615 [Histidinibacterium lentulum]
MGRIEDLDPAGVELVGLLRGLTAGSAARAAAETLLQQRAGPEMALRVIAAFDAFWRQIAVHGRRPLMRHGPGCSCLGADEACLATLVEAASEGAREDALLMACLVVRPDMSPMVVADAAVLGLSLQRLVLRAPRLDPAGERPVPARLMH